MERGMEGGREEREGGRDGGREGGREEREGGREGEKGGSHLRNVAFQPCIEYK